MKKKTKKYKNIKTKKLCSIPTNISKLNHKKTKKLNKKKRNKYK